MKLIFKIARAEIRNLFYSPVAWFLAIAFLVQCAIFYTEPITKIANWQDVLVENSPDFEGFTMPLTKMIFLAQDGIFANVINNLYLFLPLLTMGLISREINGGTIKLLYSSPIKTRHIVLGKYLAVMLYNWILLGIVGIFMAGGLLSIAHVDTGLVLSALLAFYLLICAYSAIGIFMSSLTTYQIVSAVSTFLAIFVLSRIGGLWQQYDLVRDLTYFLSMSGRTTKMIAGLITTNDVIYFLLIIFMFLSFALFRLKGGMESKPWHIKALRYTGVVLAVLAIGYFTSRPGMIGYWDTTRDNINTIHPNTQAVIQDFEPGEPLEVTLYVNLLDRRRYGRGGAPETRNVYLSSLWEQYVRFKPDIKFNYVYYYDVIDKDSTLFRQYPNKTLEEIAQLTAKGMNTDFSRFISPKEIRKTIDLQPENMSLVMQLKHKGRTTFLRFFDDTKFWPDELHVSAAFKRLQQKDMPLVLYTTGNLERSIYKTGEREHNFITLEIRNRLSLVNIGFDIDSINLNTQEIPAGITALVVADPKTELSTVKQEKIRQFITKGGNVYFLGEPGKQTMLNPMLADLGVQLSEGTLVEVTKNEMPHMVLPYLTTEALSLSDQFFHAREALAQGKEMDTVKWLMPGVAEVDDIDTDKDFKRLTVFKTQSSRNTFNKMGKLVIDSLPPIFNPERGDIRKETFVTLTGLSRQVDGKEQRILISGDADFMSKLRQGGRQLTGALFSWLDFNQFPIYTPRAMPLDILLTITGATAKLQYYIFVWILPALILLLGAVILVRRKRK